MITKGKISAFQFYVMLFLSRTLTTVTYISSYTKDVRISDMLVQPVFRILFGIIIMIPVYLLYKKNDNKNLIDIVSKRSQGFSKVISIFYVIAFFYFTVVTIARLDVFTGTVVFPETNVNFMLVFVITFCCYGAYLGFEALGRSSVLSAVLVIPAIVFILFALVNKVDFLNLSPVFYNGVTPVIKTAIDSVVQTVEYVIIAIALPKVTGNIKKGFFVWLLSQTLLMAILFFFAGAVMGNFASTQLFPFHSLASLARFAMFDRLDAIFTSVWIMCAFIKASLLIFLQTDILSSAFPKCKKTSFLIIISALLIIANLFIAGEIERFSIIDNSVIKIVVTGITVIIIPIIVLLASKKGRAKKCVEG